MHLVLELDCSADARLLATTRRTVAGYLEDVGAGPDESADVVLAVDEACVNVIRHAFAAHDEGRLRLRMDLDEDAVVVQVDDDGRGFDPAARRGLPSPDEVSGRGLHIIHALMTSVQVQSPTGTGGTSVRMERVLGGTGSPMPSAPAS